jgi:hypothetical protein
MVVIKYIYYWCMKLNKIIKVLKYLIGTLKNEYL